MRIFFLLTFFFLGLIAWSQSIHDKKVTIELSNITLEEACTILSISYGVEFSYSDNVVPIETVVSLSIRNESLPAALDKLLRGLGIGYKFTGNRVILKRLPITLTQNIRGYIRDAVTNDPIPGVTVLVQSPNGDFGASSDSSGRFKVHNIPVGRINVIVTCVGYHTRTVASILLGTGKELVLDLRISESVTAMDEVVIMAPKPDAIPGDGLALTSSKSFSVEQSKRYAGSLGDPARMVTAFAGVTAASDESNALIIRGNSPRGVLWKIDGVEVPNPNHFASEGASGGVVSTLSSNIIESSDFLTGAFPAQYGNALSGVFDIKLKNGNNENKEYSAQAGLLGLEFSAEGPFSRKHPSSYLINYRYSTLSILDKLGVELSDAGQYRDYQDISFKVNYPTSRAGIFSLFGLGGKSRSHKKVENISDVSSSDLGIMALTYENKLGDHGSIQGALSWTGTEIKKDSEVSELSPGPVLVEESYTKSYVRAAISARRRMHTRFLLEGGITLSLLDFDFYLRNRDPGNTPYQEIINFFEEGNTTITQMYVLARHYLSPTLFAFYGAHYLNFTLTQDRSFEPRAGLRWQRSETVSWSLAFGKHSRIENLQYYLGRDHQVGGNEVQINKSLGFTRANHFVLSYDQIFYSHHHLKIEPYYQLLYNAPVQLDPSTLYSSINQDTGFITDTLVNAGKGRNYGIEISIEKSFSHGFYYSVNTSLYESKFRIGEDSERNTAYNGNYNFHVLAGREFDINRRRDRFGINLKIAQAGGRPYVPIDLEKSIAEQRTVYLWEDAFEKKLPSYFRMDFQVVYKKNNPRYSMEWRLDIQNITDHRNAFLYFFDRENDAIVLKKQVGFLPLLSCRVDF